MSLRVRALLFALGAAAFLGLILHTGLATILANRVSVGWLMVPIILLYEISIWCVWIIERRRLKEEAGTDVAVI